MYVELQDTAADASHIHTQQCQLHDAQQVSFARHILRTDAQCAATGTASLQPCMVCMVKHGEALCGQKHYIAALLRRFLMYVVVVAAGLSLHLACGCCSKPGIGGCSAAHSLQLEVPRLTLVCMYVHASAVLCVSALCAQG